MKNKKKAFTLTELLVVVIVIGVLSAAVLPKFSKVIETRKTTEAEELMSSIRTEQEKRCALDKPYLTDLSDMSDIVKNTNTKNYQLTLQGKGVIASSKGDYTYTLQMPSYADGRICCDGADCTKLNKNYPSCTGFTYEESPDSCAGTVTPVEPEPAPEPKNCTGTAVTERECSSGCGTEHRTAVCNTTTGNWEYGVWDNSCAAKPAPESRECGTGYTGTQTRSAVCKNGVWDWSDWTGTCTEKCPNSSGSKDRCGGGGLYQPGTWDDETCSCICPAGYFLGEGGECEEQGCDKEKKAWCMEDEYGGSVGTWNASACSCSCPTGLVVGPKGSCVCPEPYITWSAQLQECMFSACDPDGEKERTCREGVELSRRKNGTEYEITMQLPGKSWDPFTCKCDAEIVTYELRDCGGAGTVGGSSGVSGC